MFVFNLQRNLVFPKVRNSQSRLQSARNILSISAAGVHGKGLPVSPMGSWQGLECESRGHYKRAPSLEAGQRKGWQNRRHLWLRREGPGVEGDFHQRVRGFNDMLRFLCAGEMAPCVWEAASVGGRRQATQR